MMDAPIRVLVIADSPEKGSAIAKELGEGGLSAQCSQVGTPDALAAALGKDQWDVIIADDSTPGLEGACALTVVREKAPGVPVIVVSWRAGEESAVEMLRAGARDFLPKGSHQRLGLVVERELRSARPRAEDVHLADSAASILASITDGFFSLDNNLVVTYFNAAAERLLYRKSCDVLGRPLFDSFPEARGSIFEEQYTKAVREKIFLSFEVNFEVPPYQGSYEVRVYPRQDGISVFFQVITGRKQAEEALRIREEQLLMLVKHAPAAIAMLDTQMRYIAVSDRFLKDYRLGDRDLVGLCHYDVFPEIRTLEDWLAVHRRCLAGATERREEDSFVRADGRREFVKWEIVPWRKPDASIGGVLMFTEVTTGRKQAEESLRMSEEWLRQAVRVARLGIFDHDHRTDVIQWSAEACRMCDLECEKANGVAEWIKVIHPEDRPRIASEIRKAHDPTGDGLYAVEHRIVRRDGSIRWLSVRSQTFFEGPEGARHPARTIGALLDVTESRQNEEALRKSREMLSGVLNSIPQAVFWKNCQGVYLGCNDPFAKAVGLPQPSGVVGKSDFDLPWPLGEAQKYRADDQEVILNRQPKRHIVEPLQQADGVRLWIDTSKVPLLDAEGRAYGVLGIFDDITDRKHYEEALAKYSADLERSNRDLEQFAYVASHDLQEPLRMVTSFLHLLRDHCGPSLDEPGNEYIGFAVDGALRMKDLIDGLLAYSRISRGQPPKNTSVQAAMETALANLQAGLSQAGAVVTHDPLPTIQADAVQLAQLFQNLLGNAVKFRGDSRPEIHVGARQQEGEWLFWVRDNGIGIDSRFQDRIFMIFQRLHTHHRFPGTGIGLAICKRIVERHGGRIWVESAPGQGSTFYFTISEARMT